MSSLMSVTRVSATDHVDNNTQINQINYDNSADLLINW